MTRVWSTISLILCGCASASSDITPAYTSSIPYQGYTCEQLGAEASRVSAYAAKAAGVQDKNRSHDQAMVGVGIVLFWPTLLFTNGDGQNAAELARLKGQMNAIEEASIAKQCEIQFRKG